MEEIWAKIIIILFVVAMAFVLATCVLAFYVDDVDSSILYKINNDSFIDEFKMEVPDGAICQMPNCENTADRNLHFHIGSHMFWHSKLKISNKAGFTIDSGSFVTTEECVFWFQYDDVTQDYLRKKDISNSSVDNGKTVHFISLDGAYCDEHADVAINTARAELTNAVSSTLCYVWGKTLFPWNVMILPFVFRFLLALLEAQAELVSEEVKRSYAITFVSKMLTVVVFVVLFLLCKIIEDETVRFVAQFTTVGATIIFSLPAAKNLAFAVSAPIGESVSDDEYDEEDDDDEE